MPCPSCGYDLRGTQGEQATCPECGVHVNLSLYKQSPRVGWTSCAQYRMLWNPVVVAVCCACVSPLLLLVPSLLLLMIAGEVARREVFMFGGVVLIVTLLVWITSLFNVVRRYGRAEGAFLSLLCHFLIVGYMCGVVLGGMAIAGFVYALVRDEWFLALKLFFAILLCGSFLIGMDFLDRWIGRRSLRQHVRMQSMKRMKE